MSDTIPLLSLLVQAHENIPTSMFDLLVQAKSRRTLSRMTIEHSEVLRPVCVVPLTEFHLAALPPITHIRRIHQHIRLAIICRPLHSPADLESLELLGVWLGAILREDEEGGFLSGSRLIVSSD